MEVKSKFRTLFLARKTIVFLLMFGLCFFLLVSGIIIGEATMFSAALILMFIFVFIELVIISTVFSVIISDDGIEKIAFLTREREFFPFSSIQNINMVRNEGVSSSRVGQITDGYYESVVVFKNRKELLISPDYYDNYQEIIIALRKNMVALNESI